MQEPEALLPPPGVIHERLTRNQRERAMLRALLRLSVRAAEEQRRQPDKTSTKGSQPDGVMAC